jgi:hypothetical protein
MIIQRLREAEAIGEPSVVFTQAEWDRDIALFHMAGTLGWLRETWFCRSTFGMDAEVSIDPAEMTVTVFRHDIARRAE